MFLNFVSCPNMSGFDQSTWQHSLFQCCFCGGHSVLYVQKSCYATENYLRNTHVVVFEKQCSAEIA